MCERFSKPEKYIKERLSVTIPRLLNHATTTLQTWFINFVLQIVWHIYVRRARVQVSLLFVHQFFFNNFAFSRTEYKCKVEPFDLGVSFPMRETVRKHLKQYSRRIFFNYISTGKELSASEDLHFAWAEVSHCSI